MKVLFKLSNSLDSYSPLPLFLIETVLAFWNWSFWMEDTGLVGVGRESLLKMHMALESLIVGALFFTLPLICFVVDWVDFGVFDQTLQFFVAGFLLEIHRPHYNEKTKNFIFQFECPELPLPPSREPTAPRSGVLPQVLQRTLF